MEQEKQKRRQVLLSNSILPYFVGISDDLMFFIAISTLFFTEVKGLSAAQIAFLETVSNLSCIFLQVPIIKIIQKVGNITAIRIGTIMLLCSSILITFSHHYLTIIIAYIFYQPAFLLKKMENVVIYNNLHYLHKEKDYIKIASKAKVIYAIITAVIALIGGPLFVFNHFLPMYLCIGICFINILLSFCIMEVENDTQRMQENQNKEKVKVSKTLGIILLSYALLYSTIRIGQGESQLFIQYNLNDHFDIGLTASYLSIIIAISRLSRILGNLGFQKIYGKYKEKISILFSMLAIMAFTCILIGSYLDANLFIKFIVMATGFNIILAIRDPFDVYINDLLLKNTKVEEHKKVVSYLQLSRRIAEAMISLLFSLLLIKFELSYVIACFIILTFLSFRINSKLCKIVKEK